MVAMLLLVLGSISAPDPVLPIIGGHEVATCGWPSVVALDGTCSGTLIHPQVVLYAAHCTGNPTFVTPGEIEVDGTPIDAECTANPDWDHEAGGNDFAVCVLAEPIEDVPIVPIIMGCEHQLLAPGVLATSVGFGNAPDGPMGIKRAVTYAIDEVVLEENDVWVGGDDGSLCNGDSGGGAFVQWIDGTWRLFGVHSAVLGEPCTNGKALLTLASGAVPWIESFTGFDVTPCHDADGTWNPGPDCGAFPIDPEAGGGAWPMCEIGPLGGPSSACGPPSYGPDDLAAPSVAIVQPRDGAVIPLVGALVDVDVSITAIDEGWGIDRTWLRVDGADLAATTDVTMPWSFPTLQFPRGQFVIEAVARDWAGNEGVSAAVTIVVGDPPAPPADDGGSTGDDAASDTGDHDDTASGDREETTGNRSDDDGGSTSDVVDAREGDGTGCGCRSDRSGRDPMLLLPLALIRCRRRRPAVARDRRTADRCRSTLGRA